MQFHTKSNQNPKLLFKAIKEIRKNTIEPCRLNDKKKREIIAEEKSVKEGWKEYAVYSFRRLVQKERKN